MHFPNCYIYSKVYSCQQQAIYFLSSSGADGTRDTLGAAWGVSCSLSLVSCLLYLMGECLKIWAEPELQKRKRSVEE